MRTKLKQKLLCLLIGFGVLLANEREASAFVAGGLAFIIAAGHKDKDKRKCACTGGVVLCVLGVPLLFAGGVGVIFKKENGLKSEGSENINQFIRNFHESGDVHSSPYIDEEIVNLFATKEEALSIVQDDKKTYVVALPSDYDFLCKSSLKGEYLSHLSVASFRKPFDIVGKVAKHSRESNDIQIDIPDSILVDFARKFKSKMSSTDFQSMLKTFEIQDEFSEADSQIGKYAS